MSGRDLGFFLLGLAVFFAFALAVQMRMMTGLVLKRAAKAQFPELADGPARFVVVAASNGQGLEPGDDIGDAAIWLAGEYPRAFGHLRLARRASMLLGALLLGVVAAWRFTGGEG